MGSAARLRSARHCRCIWGAWDQQHVQIVQQLEKDWQMFTRFSKWFGRHERKLQQSRAKRGSARRSLRPVEQLEDRSMLAFDCFLKIDTIVGEGAEPPPSPDHIEIESFSFGVTAPGTATPATGAGRATILDFVKLPSNPIGPPTPYVTYKMEDVLVTSYLTGGHGGAGDALPMESISMNFTRIVFAQEDGSTKSFVKTKNADIEIENDETHWVGHDRLTGRDETISVHVDRTESVNNDETITIHIRPTANNDETTNIGGNMSTDQFFFVFAPRDFCVQYRESDFDFASRIMEEEGIFYHFAPLQLPRIGQEVIVDFLEGDPDQPIVVGAVNIVDFIDADEVMTAGGGVWVFGTELPPVILNEALNQVAARLSSYEYFDYPGCYSLPSANNTPPVVSAGDDATILEGQVFTRVGSFTDGNPGPWTATVDYGDGLGEQPLLLNADKSFTLKFACPDDNTYNVTVRITDSEGLVGTDTLTVTVRNVDVIVVGADSGSPGRVRVFDSNTRALKFDLFPYERTFQGGVRVATGDVNGDGIPDIITAPGVGRQPLVKVFNGLNGQLLPGPLGSFYGFERTFFGGVSVASGDVNGDGAFDIIVARDNHRPEVRVFSGASGALLSSFFAYTPNFTGGVTVAAGDLDGDGNAEIITAPSAQKVSPLVRVFNGSTGQLVSSFLAFGSTLQGGISVAVGDVNGDGHAEIITGAGRGGAPQVKVFDGATLRAIDSFFAYPGFQGGVRVATGDVNGDGIDDIITGAGPGPNAAQKVRLFDGTSHTLIDSFFALDPRSNKGVFVAGSR